MYTRIGAEIFIDTFDASLLELPSVADRAQVARCVQAHLDSNVITHISLGLIPLQYFSTPATRLYAISRLALHYISPAKHPIPFWKAGGVSQPRDHRNRNYSSRAINYSQWFVDVISSSLGQGRGGKGDLLSSLS